jgi:hypothetical protein
MEATRCQPSSSATTVTMTSSHSCGSITNQTVRAAKARSAPRFSAFLPGSTSGADGIRPESLRYATTEPVKVTAPMNTPMKTSAEWMPAVSCAASAAAWAPPGSPSTCR